MKKSNLWRMFFLLLAIVALLASTTSVFALPFSAPLPLTREFGKISPANNANGINLPVKLKWQKSSDAVSYAYCISESSSTCSYSNVGASTEVTLTTLKQNTVYYWHVRAKDSKNNPIYSNGDKDSYWKFSTSSCYTLTLDKTGSGVKPTATPANSETCPIGQYKVGQAITVKASPASGWYVTGWTGTSNNASTSLTNTLTMPAANHTVTVNYNDCYPLTLGVSGVGGAAPTASPSTVAGCPAGQFHAGSQITLTGNPDPGYRVDAWSGVPSAASFQPARPGKNQGRQPAAASSVLLTMPAAAHSVNVTYTDCFRLFTEEYEIRNNKRVALEASLASHSLEGASTTCPVGQYHAGDVVTIRTLGGRYADIFEIFRWIGSDNDALTDLVNSVTMPGADYIVIIEYIKKAGNPQPPMPGPLPNKP